MANNYKFKLKTGEDKTISVTILDGDGVAVNLDNTDVYFTMAKGSTNYIDLVACTPDADQVNNTGVATYLITSAVSSTLAAGTYFGEFVVVDAMGLNLFYPNGYTLETDYISVIVTESKAIPA